MSKPAAKQGLRERKKAKTRWAIQEHALRLFAEQGYEATTVDQIAAAAEISPSTFFRYFPSKEDVVVLDELDEQLVDVFRAAGASSNPLGTLRAELLRMSDDLGGAIWAKARQRVELVFSVPALRARMVENLLAELTDAVDAFAEGSGRSRDDLAVRVFVAAVIGGLAPVLLQWLEGGFSADLGQLIDEAVEGLRALTSPTRGEFA